VTWGRYTRIGAIGAALLAGCLLLSFWIGGRVGDAAAARSVSSVRLVGPRHGAAGRGHPPVLLTKATPLGACEARIERTPHRAPVMAVVGASYTAGIGPNNPELSWAVRLTRMMRWNGVVYGVPGAGYVRRGNGGRGPVARLLTAEGLGRLDPALVIVQAGHDDAGVPAELERSRVAAAIRLIRSADPGARIALLTTFARPGGDTPALRMTDDAIVDAGRAADPGVIVMDPLAGRWRYAHADDGLHPTAGGDAQIARRVAAILAAHGVHAAGAAGPARVICDVTVGAGKAVAT
jgi:acyl-CoA thioesterase I